MFKDGFCPDLSVKFMTKVKAWKGVGQECNLGMTFACPGV